VPVAARNNAIKAWKRINNTEREKSMSQGGEAAVAECVCAREELYRVDEAVLIDFFSFHISIALLVLIRVKSFKGWSRR
jgi:hypothetical protein